MKTPLIALAFVVAATAATAQLAAPVAVEPAPSRQVEHRQAHRGGQAVLHGDRERVRADKERLRKARAAHDDAAIRDARARLRSDMDAWHADRERLRH